MAADEPGWRELPAGYVVPGITYDDGQPVRPLCGHAKPVAAGWVTDCDELASHARPFAGSEEYACAGHAGEATP